MLWKLKYFITSGTFALEKYLTSNLKQGITHYILNAVSITIKLNNVLTMS